jgi:chromosome segregation ATPase
MVPLIHFLIFRFKVNFHELVNASQGDNKAEIEEAQRMLEAVQSAFSESEEKARQAAEALARAKAREAEAATAVENAKKQEQEAYDRAAESAAAQKELEAALAELQAQENAYLQKTKDLEKRSEEGGVVSRNKAKAELAQHLAEDPLPLRKAKITQEAAVKKADRARLAAEAAAERSSQARAASEEARAVAERAAAESAAAKRAAEAAVEEAARRVEEAEVYLRKVKSKPGQAQGAIWWLERALYEQRKYLPSAKGGIAK